MSKILKKSVVSGIALCMMLCVAGCGEKEKADGFRRHPLFYHKDSVENKVCRYFVSTTKISSSEDFISRFKFMNIRHNIINLSCLIWSFYIAIKQTICDFIF